jgi:uncharacterized membrane protein YozB (DUF420 family)
MGAAPFVSTFIAIALIPVAFLFTHAYLSGKRHLPYHKLTGTVGILWDLIASFFYMIFRVSSQVTGAVLIYGAVHGTIAAVVILFEFIVLGTGLLQWRTGKKSNLHKKTTPILYVIWFIAFLSGEAFYIINYLL